MYLDIKQLHSLAVLEESGSLVAASERLHVTQSALSHALKALEAHLATPLFYRRSRPLRFTPAGEQLVRLAHEVLPRIAAAEQDIQSLAEGRAGRLHIAIECHSCFEWLMPTMDEYRGQWPDVEMDLSLAFSFEPLPALARGDIDLVVTSDPRDIAGIAYQPLFGYQALVAMAKDHHLTHKDWVSAEDFRHEALITYPVERRRLDVFTHFLEPAGVEPKTVRTSEVTVMMMQLIASRRGVSVLPDWALNEYLERGYIAARPIGTQGLWGTLHAAVRDEEQGLDFMQAFVNTAREVSFRTLTGIRRASVGPRFEPATIGASVNRP